MFAVIDLVASDRDSVYNMGCVQRLQTEPMSVVYSLRPVDTFQAESKLRHILPYVQNYA
jgi:hypothetical protein